MQSSNVLIAKQNKRRNISAPQHGKLGNRNEEFACNAKPKLVALGRARPVNNGSPSSNFPFLSPRGPLGKTELRCATHAVPPLCRMLSASVLPRPPRRDWNLFAKEPATCRFYVTPGKRLQETEAAKNRKTVTPRQPPSYRHIRLKMQHKPIARHKRHQKHLQTNSRLCMYTHVLSAAVL